MAASRGSTPRIGSPIPSRADSTSSRCLGEATLLMITPAKFRAGSYWVRPSATAATEREVWEASKHSTIGASTSAATCAVDPNPWVPSCPSNRPITPSITEISAPRAPWASRGATRRSPTRNGSRLRPTRPEASAW